MIYALCFALISVGLYAVLVKKNIVKMVLGIIIMEYGAYLLFVLMGYRKGGSSPIAPDANGIGQLAFGSVDPFPQMIVIAALIAGLGLLIFLVALCIRLYQRYGTFDICEMRRLKG